ncbi:MAG: FCSD flavin-binding domain-containing protein [Pseudomonadota bacterium]
MNRRRFIKAMGAAGAVSGLAGCSMYGFRPGSGHVLVIGAGAGGATCAKYLRHLDSGIKVTVVEPKTQFTTCFMSNWVIGGLRDQSWITHGYTDWSRKHGINLVHDTAVSIDPVAKVVKTKGGQSIKYDRCVVSPGVDFRYDSIEGYDEAVAETIPHAWHAGAQTALLRKQLEAMRDGGLFVLAAPPNPFRCPPGPYERASLVASYFKKHKPKSKILIMDSKDAFSKQGLFLAGWKTHYGYGTSNSMIEWRSKANDGMARAIKAGSRTIVTEFGEVKADVLNVIPAQKAGRIAAIAGLTDASGWCPVDHLTWESKKHRDIHVIGDAAIQAPIPKSGYAANSEAKVCAAAIVALLNGRTPDTPSWVNTCYSLITPDHGISVAGVYRYEGGKVVEVKGAGGLTPMNGDYSTEAIYAESWYKNIIDDMFG